MGSISVGMNIIIENRSLDEMYIEVGDSMGLGELTGIDLGSVKFTLKITTLAHV